MTQELTGTGAEHREGAAGGVPRMSPRMLVSLVLVVVGTVAFVVAMSGALVVADTSRPPGPLGSSVHTSTETGLEAIRRSLPLGMVAAACAAAPLLWILAVSVRLAWARLFGAGTCVAALASLIMVFTSERLLADLRPVGGTIGFRLPEGVKQPGLQTYIGLLQGAKNATHWTLSPNAWLWLVGTASLALAFVVMPAPQRRPIDD